MWNKIKLLARMSFLMVPVCGMFLLTTSLAFAAVAIENRTGVVSITTPDGNVITVEPGDALPDIPSGCTIEVITGTADISVTGEETVDIVLNDATVTIGSGDAVSVSIGAGGAASIEVTAGNVEVLNADGTVEEVEAGSTVAVQAAEPVATEAGITIPGQDPASDPKGASGGYTG